MYTLETKSASAEKDSNKKSANPQRYEHNPQILRLRQVENNAFELERKDALISDARRQLAASIARRELPLPSPPMSELSAHPNQGEQ
eukprot:1372910-Amorphochlora_amoeboformis.AAC.1